MKKRFLAVLIAALGNSCVLLGAGIQGNYYADQNRDIFLLPRSAAISGSDITFNRSAEPLTNPSILSRDSTREISLAYAGYFHNAYSTGGLSYINPIDNRSSFSVSVSYIYIPGIEVHPDEFIQGNEEIRSGSDLFFRVGYGRKVLDFGTFVEADCGAALNGERKNLIGWTGYGIGLDGGASLLFKLKEIGSRASVGLLLENLTTTFTHWSSQYKEYAYPHARVGLGWQSNLEYFYGRISFSYLSPDLFSNEGINSYQTDNSDPNSSVQTPEFKRVATNPSMLILGAHAGLEYLMVDRLALRIGLYNGNWSFGAGLHLMENRFGFDFAYLNSDLAPTYKIGITSTIWTKDFR
jgi:hypothetical protein